ncbi:Gamma-aminobutyric acid (GABA) B receptor [Seminavis robusta]|uniref:Gamma-aminobutyric acid (GABA) B receptor n=1 Tax=Seminavis robusta TaxID=568900 RepID=A0A9N8HR55_9STRA|nr:Gamma-aminobutyric acid (GABA) B receptor [Seminavis robusta]|eukprot:Sro1229_g254440.1 Gamma-aminobutyric acid (GABA) B receptor (1021) ;mRNA; f:1466-4696
MSDTMVASRIRSTDNGGREGHLMSLLPLSRRNSETGERALQEFRVYVELSAFLAFQHIQHRTGSVLPELPQLLESCDFSWTYRHHDTQFSPLQAATEVMSYELPRHSRQAKPWSRPTANSTTTTTISNAAAATTISTAANNSDSIWHDVNDYWSLPVVQEVVTVATGDSTEQDNNHHHNNNDYWSLPHAQLPEPTAAETPRTSVPREAATVPPRTAVPLRTKMPWATAPPRGNTRLLSEQSEQPQQKPFAILGAARSVTSQAVGILGSAFELPQISSSSTASSLDALPFFARTVPTNEGDAHATIVYLKQQLHVSNIGVLHSEDSWGRRYEQDLQYYGKQYGVDVKSVAYTVDSLDQAMEQLQETNLRYFVGIINSGAWKPVVKAAYAAGLMGNPRNQWFIGDLVALAADGFALDRETEQDIALALHGTGVVFLQVTPHTAFDQALAAVADNVTLQQEFIAAHDYSDLLTNFTFSSSPGMSLFQYLTYDAIISLGLTACNTPGLFTGREFYQQLLQVDFEGVSGRVNLNEDTGTRLGDSLRYQIVNMVLDDYFDNNDKDNEEDLSVMTFSANVSSTVELSPPNSTGPMVHAVQPFIYHDNTTNPPLALPPHEEDLNLISDGVKGFGLSLSVLGMLLSLGIGAWVLRNRNIYVIRASQPIFLVQLCVGTFLLALVIVPLGVQEPSSPLALDVACNAVPWLWSLGFATSISAIFSKTRRINQLMNSGTGFRRVQIKARDVMKPTVVLIAINLIILTSWSASPWRMSWQRITNENHVDKFGRSEESYGACRPGGNYHFFFTTPLVLTNAIILGMTTFQSYRARELPSEFSETAYMALSMISLSETFLLGIMIVFPVLDQPTAFYLLSSMLFFVGCCSILGPMFLPKFALRNTRAPRGRNAASVAIRRNGKSTVGRSVYMSGISGIDNSGGFNSGGSGSGSRLMSVRSAHGSGGSNFIRHGSSSLQTGTYHGVSTRPSADISPFGSSSMAFRTSSSDHVRSGRGARGTLSTTPEERDSVSESFH